MLKPGKKKSWNWKESRNGRTCFFFVPIFSFNIKDKFQYPRKIYPGDTGFIQTVSKEIRMGKIYESAVFLSLRRKLQPDEEIGHWKDQSHFEVDFVTRKGLEVGDIIQVSMGENIKEREFRAGLKAAKEFKKDEVLIIGDIEGTEQRDGITFRLIPLRQWLL